MSNGMSKFTWTFHFIGFLHDRGFVFQNLAKMFAPSVLTLHATHWIDQAGERQKPPGKITSN